MKKRFFAMVLSCMAVCSGVLATSDPGALDDIIDPALLGLARVGMPVVPPASYNPQNYEGFYPPHLVEEFAHVLAPDEQRQFKDSTRQMNLIFAARQSLKDGEDFLTEKLPAFRFDDPTLTPSDLEKAKGALNVFSDTTISTYGFAAGHLIYLTVGDRLLGISPKAIGFKKALNEFCKKRHYPYGASIYTPDGDSLIFGSVLEAYNDFVSDENASRIGQTIHSLHLSEAKYAVTAVVNGLVVEFHDKSGR
jgi:hypothetical protein